MDIISSDKWNTDNQNWGPIYQMCWWKVQAKVLINLETWFENITILFQFNSEVLYNNIGNIDK